MPFQWQCYNLVGGTIMLDEGKQKRICSSWIMICILVSSSKMTARFWFCSLEKAVFYLRNKNLFFHHYRRFTLIYLKYIIFWLEYALVTSHCKYGTKQDHINVLGKGSCVGPNLCLNSSGSEGVEGAQKTLLLPSKKRQLKGESPTPIPYPSLPVAISCSFYNL